MPQPGSTQNIQNALQSFCANMVINHDKLLPQNYSFRTKLIRVRGMFLGFLFMKVDGLVMTTSTISASTPNKIYFNDLFFRN